MYLAADLLTYRMEATAIVDFFRVMVAFLGAVHLIFAIHRFLTHQAFWTGIAFMATGLLTILQQMEALEQDDFIPWRLPLYALMNIAGIVYLYKLGRNGTDTCTHN